MEQQETEHLVELSSLADGAAIVLFNRELQKCIDNIADPNTVAKAKRSVTLTVTILPDVDRKKADVVLDVKSSLAQDRGADTTIWFGKKDGRNVAAEQNMNQGMLFDKDKKEGRVFPMALKDKADG